MNWKKLNFDWQSAKFFYLVAKEGSFTAAANAIEASQPTLSRHIANLEEDLGVSLFERSVKGLTLTDAGKNLFNIVEQMANSAQELTEVAQSQSREMTGDVCISVNEILAACLLPKVVKQVRYSYPDIQLEVISTDDISDLSQREADIAIRAFRPAHPELIVKKLKPLKTRFYATKEYLNQFPQPITFESLKKATFIDFNKLEGIHELLPPAYANLAISHLPLHIHSSTLRLELIKEGVGIGLILESLGKNNAEVVDVFPDLPSIEFDIWLVARNEIRNAPRIKAVFDIIANNMQDN